MNSQTNPFEKDLDKNPANHAPLTPLGFIERTAAVYPQRVSVVHGAKRYTWRETYARCRRLGSALAKRGIGAGDTVAVMLANTPEMYECHFGVPMTGGVLNALNTRLDAEAIAFMLEHGGAKILITDREFSPTVKAALAKLKQKPVVIDVDDSEYAGPGERLGANTYEELLAEGDPDYAWQWPTDEWNSICLGYTSGTTGDPKGVVYHHRGAYLNAICNIVTWGMPHHAVYLWTLPMFHCTGWCFPWAVTAMGGVHLCLAKVEASAIWRSMRESGVTHLCAAPTVLTMTIWDPGASRLPRPVRIGTGGAPPTPALIERLAELGMDITHLYGLTETYGPAVICDWRSEWNELPLPEQARLKARQGVGNVIGQRIRVVDEQGVDVPADAESMGEIAIRGNNVMLGYYKDDAATQKACPDGWFRTGDLGVMHPDGYVELKDRSKDIIISGGEWISSTALEDALLDHPAVLETAVVAGPDEKWGEVPVAFVSLKSGEQLPEKALIEHAREKLAHFKAPRAVVFGELPKTSTGKVQKYVLRDRAKSLLVKKQ